MARPNPIDATLALLEPLARDTVRYTLELATPLPFVAGQFLNLAVPDAPPRGERSYSIYSDPVTPTRVELVVRLVRGGAASEWLRQVQPGDRMVVRGPFGRFTLDDAPGPHYFVGTGTGLAPFRAMLEVARRVHDPRSFRLLFGVRAEADLFALEDLEAYRRDLADFSYTVCLSQPASPGPRYHGRVTSRLREIDLPPSAHGFLCGNGAMIEEARTILTDAGLDRHHIHFEKYY